MWVGLAIGGWDRKRVAIDLGNLKCKINSTWSLAGDGHDPELPELFGPDDGGVTKQDRDGEGCQMIRYAGPALSPEPTPESWPDNLLILGASTGYFTRVVTLFSLCQMSTLSLMFFSFVGFLWVNIQSTVRHTADHQGI